MVICRVREVVLQVASNRAASARKAYPQGDSVTFEISEWRLFISNILLLDPIFSWIQFCYWLRGRWFIYCNPFHAMR